MSLLNQIIIIIGCYFISLIYLRGFLYGVIRFQLNKSAYKKRKKETTFKEWLFYTKYIEEIPKMLRTLYYFVLFIHPLGLISCVFVYLVNLPYIVGETIAIVIASFDVVWILVIALLFWSPGRDYAYERWIPKKRGQNKTRKNKK